MDNTLKSRYHHPFHKLWSEAVGAPKYNKKAWQDLDEMLWDSFYLGDEKKAERVMELARQLRDLQVQRSLPENG